MNLNGFDHMFDYDSDGKLSDFERATRDYHIISELSKDDEESDFEEDWSDAGYHNFSKSGRPNDKTGGVVNQSIQDDASSNVYAVIGLIAIFVVIGLLVAAPAVGILVLLGIGLCWLLGL